MMPRLLGRWRVRAVPGRRRGPAATRTRGTGLHLGDMPLRGPTVGEGPTGAGVDYAVAHPDGGSPRMRGIPCAPCRRRPAALLADAQCHLARGPARFEGFEQPCGVGDVRDVGEVDTNGAIGDGVE